MGMLRLALAIIVVLVHAGKSIGIGGAYAVEFFFAISGYVIALSLDKNTEYSNYIQFVKSRFLRIAPAYYAVCSILLLLSLININLIREVSATFTAVGLTVKIQLFVANLTVISKDVVMFTGFVDGKHIFVSDFWSHEPLLFHGLLIPQAWSLSLEIYFYLIAPWVIRKRNVLVFLLVSSLLFKVSGCVFGFLANDPWNYRFFPSELCMFLFGTVSYQYLQKWRITNPLLAYVISFSFSGIVLISHRLEINGLLNGIILFILLLVLLPTLASIQKASAFDSFCAKLSYPVYIVHLAIVELVETLLQLNHFLVSPNVRVVAIIVLTLVAGYVIHHLVEVPVSRFVKDRWKTTLRTS